MEILLAITCNQNVKKSLCWLCIHFSSLDHLVRSLESADAYRVVRLISERIVDTGGSTQRCRTAHAVNSLKRLVHLAIWAPDIVKYLVHFLTILWARPFPNL